MAGQNINTNSIIARVSRSTEEWEEINNDNFFFAI